MVCIVSFLLVSSGMANVVVPPPPSNYNYNHQGQIQVQGQNQTISTDVDVNFPGVGEIRERILVPPEAHPINIPIYQNGKITNWNDYLEIPIEGATYLKKGEVVKKVITVLKGNPLWRIRAEDVLSKIIDNKIEGEKVRYFVIKKGSVSGIGFSPGGAASAPIGNGMGTVIAPLGFASSTVDDEFYITFVEIK